MSRKPVLAAAVFTALAIIIGRQFVQIPFVSPSGREMVARLSGLPIPIFARSEGAVDECSGIFCKDYYGRGLIRLGPADCAKATAAARTQGWRSLPLPGNLDVLQETGAPPTPHVGYFRLEQKHTNEQAFAWVDTATCRVYAEVDIS